MYGMTSTGGYAAQYSRQLERDVTRNKTSVGDYYARKAEMLKILMTDNDSGESCTRGKNRSQYFMKLLLLIFKYVFRDCTLFNIYAFIKGF